jgi:CO dehydrogenase/acetyl-CoA synthase gamma subunit (corrinoid Fe-S protein)
MKRISFLICALLLFNSCDLKETFERIHKLESELKEEFKDPNISADFTLTNDEDSSFYQVSFYKYDIANKTNAELKARANKVYNFIIKKIGKNARLNYIEVRFTESEKDKAYSFTNFRYNKYD